jgi:uncharacterized protein
LNYVDTSILLSAMTQEIATDRAQRWLAEQPPESIAISLWTITEFSSGLSIKLRTGQIDQAARAASLNAFGRYTAETLVILPVSDEAFQTAAHFADQSTLAIKSADALNLAIVAGAALSFVTLDRRLAKAALALGVAVELL